MDPTILIAAIALMAVIVGAVLMFSGPNQSKALKRRVTAFKERHAPDREAALAAQMRKTIAARLPNRYNRFAELLPRRDRLELRLRRTGKKWQLGKFAAINVAIMVAVILIMMLQGAPIYLAIPLSILLGLGLPHFFVSRLISKRVATFNSRFPDAIDLLVRGLRSGLPISETLQVVSGEIPGPVGEEFKAVTERVRIGRSMEAALQESADVIGTPEFQFFCITLAIQRETGGNLAETLANLSEVLRKRAQMKLKIKAMSSEAKASAWIVGALPFVVFGMIYMVNYEYVAGFFREQRLIVAGIGGLVWMSIGVGIMAKMVNFEI